MTSDEMKASSKKKFDETLAYLKEKQVAFECRQKVNSAGFVENVVIFTDNEQYPADPVEQVEAEVVQGHD